MVTADDGRIVIMIIIIIIIIIAVASIARYLASKDEYTALNKISQPYKVYT